MGISGSAGAVRVVLNSRKRTEQAENRLIALSWGKLSVGVGLVVLAGTLWFTPLVAGQVLFWLSWVGGTGAGLLLLLCAIGDRRIFVHRKPIPRAARRTYPPQANPVPRLGQILVHDMRVVSQEELQQALAERRRRGCRTGEAVVEMGCITRAQLEVALASQRFCAEHYRPTGRAEATHAG